MSFYEFYRKFFSFKHEGVRPSITNPDEDDDLKKPRESLWESGEEDNIKNFPDVFNFNVSIDPFEIHRLLEQSFSDIFKTFTILDGFSGNYGVGDFEDHNLPAIKEEHQNARDLFLKSGYNKNDPCKGINENEGVGELLVPVFTWMDTFFSTQVPQEESLHQPQKFSSFTSITTKIIKSPDGSVKREEIIRTGDGTEQTTESHTIFDGNHSPSLDNLMKNPGLFDYHEMPDMNIPSPRYQLLKPGYEKLNPYSGKIDKDLDRQILNSGIESLPVPSKDPEIIEPKPNFSYKIFTKKTITLPSGVVQSEELFQNSDGTEQRTVTETLPDGTSSKPETLFGTSNPAHDMMNQQREEYSKKSVSLSIKDLIDNFFK